MENDVEDHMETEKNGRNATAMPSINECAKPASLPGTSLDDVSVPSVHGQGQGHSIRLRQWHTSADAFPPNRRHPTRRGIRQRPAEKHCLNIFNSKPEDRADIVPNNVKAVDVKLAFFVIASVLIVLYIMVVFWPKNEITQDMPSQLEGKNVVKILKESKIEIHIHQHGGNDENLARLEVIVKYVTIIVLVVVTSRLFCLYIHPEIVVPDDGYY